MVIFIFFLLFLKSELWFPPPFLVFSPFGVLSPFWFPFFPRPFQCHSLAMALPQTNLVIAMYCLAMALSQTNLVVVVFSLDIVMYFSSPYTKTFGSTGRSVNYLV